MASFQAKIGLKRPRMREKIKIIDPFRSYPKSNIKFEKNCKKNLKIKKYHFFSLFQAKIVWKRPRKRENKNYRFITFLHDA